MEPKAVLHVLSTMSKEFPNARERMTREQREAKDAERRRDGEQAMRDHQRAQDALHKNMHRLKAERLARETDGKK